MFPHKPYTTTFRDYREIRDQLCFITKTPIVQIDIASTPNTTQKENVSEIDLLALCQKGTLLLKSLLLVSS